MEKTRFVMDFGQHNFYQLLNEHADKDDTLYIATYGFSLEPKLYGFIKRFKRTVLVVNPCPFGKKIQENEKKTEDFHSVIRNPSVELYFNRFLHSKIVLTSNISYVGSANFTAYSKNNIESGFVSTCENTIKEIRNEFTDTVLSNSFCLRELAQHFNNYNINNSIKQILPLFEPLIGLLDSAQEKYEGFRPDRGQSNLDDLDEIINKIETIDLAINTKFEGDELGIVSNLNITKWLGRLKFARKNLETFIKEGARLMNRAMKDDCYDTLTLADYNEKYGEGTTEIYEEHRHAFENALANLKVLQKEIKYDFNSFKYYLYTLISLGVAHRNGNNQ